MTITSEAATYRFYRKSEYYTRSSPGPVVYIFDDTMRTLGYNTVDRNPNPNWKQQIASGLDASMAYSRKSMVIHPMILSSGDHIDVSPWRVCSNKQYFTGFAENYFNDSDDSVLMDQALARFKSKIRSKVGHSKALVPLSQLGDLRKTIRNLAKFTKQKLPKWDQLRRNRNRKKAFDAAADWWLTFNFGVKPFVDDVATLTKSIQDFLDGRGRRTRVWAYAEKEWTTAASSLDPATYHCDWATRIGVKHRLSYMYLGGVDTRLLSGNNYGVNDFFGLGLGELPSVGWELLPYSWVVDYFTTIGAYLDDTFVLPPGSTKYLVRTKRYVGVSNASSHVVPNYTYPKVKIDYERCVPGVITYDTFSRTKLTGLPHASLRIRTLDEIGFSSVTKLINLASIAIKQYHPDPNRWVYFDHTD